MTNLQNEYEHPYKNYQTLKFLEPCSSMPSHSAASLPSTRCEDRFPSRLKTYQLTTKLVLGCSASLELSQVSGQNGSFSNFPKHIRDQTQTQSFILLWFIQVHQKLYSNLLQTCVVFKLVPDPTQYLLTSNRIRTGLMRKIKDPTKTKL